MGLKFCVVVDLYNNHRRRITITIKMMIIEIKIFGIKTLLFLVFDCVGVVRQGRLCHPGSAGPGSRDQPNLEMLREKLIMQDI